MFYEPRLRNHGLPHDPFKALVAPRPIGWISTLSAEGRPNLAPYSFFNAFSERPAIVGFSSQGMKDSATNARDTGEFVCNIVSERDAAAMNASSGAYPPGISEFEKAGLEMEPSRLVRPPRVKGILAALECRTTALIPLAGLDGVAGPYTLVLGEVVGIHIDDAVLKDGQVDSRTLRQLARLGYMDYAAVERVFALERPRID
ncbi:MAG: flavin reductase family protein [Hyphomicrobiales bacterium]|nr:flavin reductase family protein [Hyphomicrobiales bacterium]MCA1999346.1 flavin reductase family protein [Hyphomicrobiales bacterium]